MTKSFDLFQDRLCRCGPDEGPAAGVVLLDELLDPGNEFLDTFERSPADGALGNEVEPDLDLVEPGGRCGGEVHVVSGPRRQPTLDGRMLVRGVVVHDEVNVQLDRHTGIDSLEKAQILLMAMTFFAGRQNLAGCDVQGGKEGRGAVAHVIVGDSFHVADAHRQKRLGAVQGLNPALLVDAEHHGLVRRVQIQPDDVADLLHEEGVGGELEVALPMRLQPESTPDAMNRRGADLRVLGHRTDAPVGGPGGLALEGLVDQLGDFLVGDGTRSTGTHLVVQTRQSVLQIALAPLADHLLAQADLLGDHLVGQPFGGQQDDAGPGHQTVRQTARAGPGLQLLLLVFTQHDGDLGSSCLHGHPPSHWDDPMIQELYT